MATTPLIIANCEELNTQFNEALNTAPAWLLNQIIRDVCIWVPVAIPLISDGLLVTEDQVAVKHDDDDLDSNPESESEPASEPEADGDAGSEASVGQTHPLSAYNSD